MKTSPTIANLSKALLKAQAQMGSAAKDAKNPFFKSKYADLPTVMEVVKGPLNENGLVILQPGAYREGKNFIDTFIIHSESGEFISSETEVVCAKAGDAQNFGSGQTYARRFGLQSLLFIPAEDDDGNYASGKSAPAKAYSKPAASTSSLPTPYSPTPSSPTLGALNQAFLQASDDNGGVLVPNNTTTLSGMPGTPTVVIPPPATTLEPLKRSSFNKKKAEPAKVPNTIGEQPGEPQW